MHPGFVAQWLPESLNFVHIAGKQMRVHENDVIKVPLLADEVGSSVEFDQVLFVSDDAREGMRAFLEKRAPEYTGT